MRVLHVAPHIDPRWGGIAVALAGLARAQVQAGIDVAIVVTYHRTEPLDALDGLQADGIDIRAVGPGITPLLWHPRLARVMDRAVARANVVHVHSMWTEVQEATARAARRHDKPYVLAPHGTLAPWSLSQSSLRKKIYLAWRGQAQLDDAAALHFTTSRERELVQLRLRAAAIVEPNGVDMSEFSELPPIGAFRRRHPEVEGRPMLLFLSRIHKKKGLDLLIPAFAEVPGDAVLVIAGPDGGQAVTVRELTRRHGVADRVLFTGMLHGTERIAAMVDADLFVLPSYQENFGMVVVEALAAGTAVVISDQVNIHDVITDHELGEVVPTDVQPLADALRRWLGDAQRREAIGARARSFVTAHYDWRRIAERWVEHYLRLTHRKAG